MTPDQRRRVKHGPFSTWQWAVIGSYLVAIVLSFYVGGISARADQNAKSGNAAICVVNGFLRNSLMTTEDAIRADPNAPETDARRESAERLRVLVTRLEDELPSCRTALR